MPDASGGRISPLVAVLGGGQLGRMLALAGVPLGLRFRFLDPGIDAPAGALGSLVVGELGDEAALGRVTEDAAVVTYEWEGVPAAGARFVETSRPVLPPPVALDVAQDRLREKELCRRLGIATPEFAAVDDRAGLERAVQELGLPAVLKTRRGGYDGKGQVVLGEQRDVERALAELRADALILEAHVPFDRELSVLAVRGRDGATSCWPLVENHHADGILRWSLAPAPMRAILGWPLGSTAAVGVSAMVNCIGALPDASIVLAISGTHFHDYGKAPRPGRKVGHVTLTARDHDDLRVRMSQLAGLPGMDVPP